VDADRQHHFDETTFTMTLDAVSMAEAEANANNMRWQASGQDNASGGSLNLSQQLLLTQHMDEARSLGGTRNKEQDFRRIIRKLRQHKVDLFGHLVHDAKSIKFTVDLLTDDGWSATEKYHRCVALGEKVPWSITLKRTMCPTSIDISNRVRALWAWGRCMCM
jgi:hypothetical protein